MRYYTGFFGGIGFYNVFRDFVRILLGLQCGVCKRSYALHSGWGDFLRVCTVVQGF